MELEHRIAAHGVWVKSGGASGSRFKFAADEVVSSVKALSFRGRDLRKADFCGAFLPSVDFSDARLAGADFTGAYLRRAKFHNADLTGAQFKGAVLRDVSATRAWFEAADLRGANLLNSSFDAAMFKRACLAHANLRNASFLDADMTGADLTDANQSRTGIGKADPGDRRPGTDASLPGPGRASLTPPRRRFWTDRMVVVAVYIALGLMIGTLGLWSIIMIFITLRRVP